MVSVNCWLCNTFNFQPPNLRERSWHLCKSIFRKTIEIKRTLITFPSCFSLASLLSLSLPHFIQFILFLRISSDDWLHCWLIILSHCWSIIKSVEIHFQSLFHSAVSLAYFFLFANLLLPLQTHFLNPDRAKCARDRATHVNLRVCTQISGNFRSLSGILYLRTSPVRPWLTIHCCSLTTLEMLTGFVLILFSCHESDRSRSHGSWRGILPPISQSGQKKRATEEPNKTH